jgi:hypothetical protein
MNVISIRIAVELVRAAVGMEALTNCSVRGTISATRITDIQGW